MFGDEAGDTGDDADAGRGTMQRGCSNAGYAWQQSVVDAGESLVDLVAQLVIAAGDRELREFADDVLGQVGMPLASPGHRGVVVRIAGGNDVEKFISRKRLTASFFCSGMRRW